MNYLLRQLKLKLKVLTDNLSSAVKYLTQHDPSVTPSSQWFIFSEVTVTKQII